MQELALRRRRFAGRFSYYLVLFEVAVRFHGAIIFPMPMGFDCRGPKQSV